jgi:NAD(P)-dependent dehydrogenase (short-subunit alcohol dehydrogenase family)
MNIVMTGATAGIGAEALNHFANEKNRKIYVGARGNARLVPDATVVLPLDLSSLKSVHSFADNVKRRLANEKIDVLVLNAGVQATTNQLRSEEGFELTFATNHLSHYLLARLLLPSIKEGGKVIMTTSDAHDPAVIPFGPKELNIQELAYPTQRSPKGMAFYAATKLCNLLTISAMESKFGEIENIAFIAFNPGLTGDTSLMGKQSGFIRFVVSAIRPLFHMISFIKPAFYMGTAKRSGEALADLALGKVIPPKGKIYASLVRGKLTFPSPSVLAQDDYARDLLWNESAGMVGLPV